MSYIRHTIFVSIFFFQNSLSNDSINSNSIHQVHFDIKSLYASEVPEEIRKKIMDEIIQQQQNSNSTKKDGAYSEIEIKEMELVFESSPTEAQLIVNHLQDPTYFPDDKDYRSAIFYGVPGSGKTVTANAIAYKMSKAGWNCKIISSPSLLGEHRNQTAMNLERELKSAVASKKPTLIIIDELHRLLENSDSKHHDTDLTSTALWTFLDKQEGNENFFLIGTMNRIDKLPQPFKNRIISDYIHFPLTTDSKIKNKLIRMYLTTENSFMDEEVTDDFLNKELEKLNDCAGRCLKKISRAIGRKNRINDSKKSSVTAIKKATITEIADEYTKRKTDIRYNWIDESDEERQERHHKENLELHEKHFVQRQKIEMAIIENKKITGDLAKHYAAENQKIDSLNQAIDSLMSDEQKTICKNTMANTEERKAREAAEKKAAEEKAAAEKARIDEENSWRNRLRKLF